MTDGLAGVTYRKYNGLYPLFNNNTPIIQNFVGTVTISSGLTSSVATSTGYDMVVQYYNQSGRFRVDGTGTFKARVLLIGSGLNGGSGASGVSGDGGDGGSFNYYVDYEFQAGVQYSLQVWSTTGNVVIAINPDSYPNPPYQELVVITPGGGVAGAAGVSGLSNGATGSVGTISDITGTNVSYGGAGGSGASIPASGFGVTRDQLGGKGNNFYNSVNNGNGGDAQRYSTDIINSVSDGDPGTSLTGNGGGGGGTVYARAAAFPNAFGWYNGGGGAGGTGTIIIRYSVI
jgi:collagen type III alpha